ncbi:uncharacterized protein LOC107759537 [Nicotiana tabacum]|uniref:Uncharacterized protein LOC107759537 n=1 Tax=Nicotiana tabacum TaxID=4097 RepID=A0AC58UIE4_TOBAC
MAIEDILTPDGTQSPHATAVPQGISGNQVPGNDYNHPLFLSPADERVNAIVLSWMMNSVPRELLGGIMYASSVQAVWSDLHEKFNKIDGSRSFNLHKEIAILNQGTTSISVYFSKLKDLWEEFEALVPAPRRDCAKSREFVTHLQKLKLFQFLMGLNESYSQARRQILMMSPTPIVNQAYGLIINDEGQRSVAATTGLLGANLATYASHYNVAMYTRTGHGRNQKFRKNYNVQCEFCKMKGHSKENCYKIVGYPLEFKNRKKGGVGVGNSTYNVMTESNVQFRNTGFNGFTDGNSQINQPQTVGNAISQGLPPITTCIFSKEQYEQILHILNKSSSVNESENPTANAVGISLALLASTSPQEWIINTSATNHMVVDINLLNKNSAMQPEFSKSVFLPNGDITHVAHTGSIAFFPNICIFQDLFNGQVRAIGREDSGLYILSGSLHIVRSSEEVLYATNESPVIVEVKTDEDIDLWHKRCGHIPVSVLKRILSSVKTEIIVERIDKLCENMFRNLGIIHQKSCAYTPQQNGVAERKHIHILEVIRAVRFQKNIPIKFWGQCVLSAVYLINRMPNTVICNQTPYERDVSFREDIFPFKKNSENSATTIFAQDSSVQKLLYEAIETNSQPFTNSSQRVAESDKNHHTSTPELIDQSNEINLDTQFLVHQGESCQADHIIESQQPGMIPSTQPTHIISTNQNELRKSQRDKRPPLWLQDFVSLNTHQDTSYALNKYIIYENISPKYQDYTSSISLVIKPNNYAEAIKDPRWIEAMQAEIKALQDNHTWDIVNLQEGKYPISCKWIYKIKYKATREVENFKARLVAKGFSQ